MDIVDRIFELVDEKYQEQQNFAVDIGVIPQRVSAWRRRTYKSYIKYLPKIAEVLDTTPEYLLTGEGAKKKGDTLIAGTPFALTQAEYEIVLAYRKADARTRSMVDLALEPFKVPSSSEKAM